MNNLLGFEPVNERMCKIRAKLNTTVWYWYQHKTEEKDEVAKGEFYRSLEKAFDAVPNYDTKTVLGDFNAEVGKDNGKRTVKLALGRD